MIYQRSEIVALVRQQPVELQSTLISIIWFASHSDPNLIEGNRYGLLQIDSEQVKKIGFQGEAIQLLDPELNIKLGAQLLAQVGLVEFCGRALGMEIPRIAQLANYLDSNTEIVLNV